MSRSPTASGGGNGPADRAIGILRTRGFSVELYGPRRWKVNAAVLSEHQLVGLARFTALPDPKAKPLIHRARLSPLQPPAPAP